MKKDNKLKGPERRTYYDMNPWYLKNRESGLQDWHQHVTSADTIFLNHINAFKKDKKPQKILEVGCGGGDFTLSYAEKGIHHEAFEFSSVAIEMAKEKINPTGVLFREGDALDSDSYTGKPYELIISKDVLHCILGEDRRCFLKKMKEALKINGCIFLSTHVGLPQNEDVLKYVNLESRENHFLTRVYYDENVIDQEILEAELRILEKTTLEGQLVLYKLGI